MLPPSTVLAFQNTGREAWQTLDYLERLEQDLGRPIVRLEWRSPARGEPPRMATFEIVEHSHLARRGEPFRDMLECLATFRAKVKRLGPVAPWGRQRICTAFLKIKTYQKYVRSLGWEDWTVYCGLRRDEPERVASMNARNSERGTDERAPLYEANISKADVLAFWRAKSYDLELPEHMGNCTGCFLKDERDLADALGEVQTDAQWWIDIERDYAPMRRGRPSYAQVLAELPQRLRIRDALERGANPVSDLPARRHRLVVRQELAPREGFSCQCEGAEKLTDDAVLAM